MTDDVGLVDVIVEWLAGDDLRYEWHEATGLTRALERQEKSAPPEHYGCVPGALSPADGELLDVLMLRDGTERRPGELVPVRLIGVLRRSDGDHKLVVVDPRHSSLRHIDALDEDRRRAMWRWFPRQHVLLRWEGPEAAADVLEDARQAWRLVHGLRRGTSAPATDST